MTKIVPASQLEVGDVIVVDGVPVDIIRIEAPFSVVRAYLSDDPEDCCRFPCDAIVQVVAHFEPLVYV